MDSVTNVLTDMHPGDEGEIVSITAGLGAQERLENMGIIKGRKIKVISIQKFRGPITIQINRNQIALGHGISEKIFIKKQQDA